MTEFKPGDRVRVVNDTHVPAYNGVTGVVEKNEGTGLWPVRVIFDAPVDARGGTVADIFDPGEIELVSTATAEPVDPNLQALRERLIEQAVKAAGFERTYSDIVDAARAYEAYITGATK